MYECITNSWIWYTGLGFKSILLNDNNSDFNSNFSSVWNRLCFFSLLSFFLNDERSFHQNSNIQINFIRGGNYNFIKRTEQWPYSSRLHGKHCFYYNILCLRRTFVLFAYKSIGLQKSSYSKVVIKTLKITFYSTTFYCILIEFKHSKINKKYARRSIEITP